MILKGISLCGFKSFYRKVNLDFGSGITAIVGPNGCGKSNIADAIRWVLGEQNPRVLRGKRMDDTIFKGTQSRKPLNMTEVSLVFDNSNGSTSLPYEEVTVTRKLFRSGESEYRINDLECRLKDVTDLILDAGIGNDAYSLIEQKMIDAILNGRSGERRRIIEEAAGIVKYKERRRQAIRKLERTRHDLDHIQVLVDEVERTVRGLKRHVGKAKRYKAFREREREIDIVVARNEAAELGKRDDIVRGHLKTLEEERRAALVRLQGIEDKLRECKTGLMTREERLNAMREDLKGRILVIKSQDERLAILRERTTHRRQRQERIGIEMTESRASVESLEEERKALASEREEKSLRLEEVSGRLVELEAERSLVEGELQGEENRFRAGEKDRLRRLEAVTENKARLGALKSERASLTERMERLDREIGEKQSVIDRSIGEREGFSEEIAELKTVVDQMSLRLRKLSRLREKIGRRRDFSDSELKKQQLQLNNVTTQLEMQKRWRDDYEGYPPGVASVLREREKLPGIVGTVGDLFEIEEQFARAIETGLAPYLKMVVSESTLSALNAINFLRSEGKGVASFISLEMIRSMADSRVTKPPPWVIASGIDVVRCEPKLRPLRDVLLGDLWIVPPPQSREDFDEYLNAQARVISLDGSLLRDGMVIGGGVDGRDIPFLLQRSKRIEDLEREATSLSQMLDKTESGFRKLNQLLKGADEEYSKLQNRSSMETEALREKEVMVQTLEREGTLLREEIRRLQEERNHLFSLQESKEKEIRELETAREEAEREVSETDEPDSGIHLDLIKDRKNALDKEIEGLKVEGAALGSILTEYGKRLEGIERTIGNRMETIQRLESESASLEAELVLIGDEDRQLREGRDETARLVDRLDGDVSRSEDEIRIVRAEVSRDEEDLGKLRREIEEKVSRIQNLVLEKNDLQNRASSLRERIEEKYGIDISELPPIGDGEDIQVEDLKQELGDIRSKISSLGYVNFVALEEYEREEERCALLRSQRDDLVESKESLEKTIRKINRTAREQFIETFDRVRENFQETFRVLFRGGRADLIMADGEDPLEAEIDMVAQPLGKRLESIDLLSGGERALTALALLFGIYLVKPSPFCILDEADAALDDANVDRLLEMLFRFKRDTQFILITHNKKTMSAANCLYGVTMAEPGISKIVSVSLDETDGGKKGHPKKTVTREETASV